MPKPINAAGYRQATYELAMKEQPRVVVEVGVYAGGLSKLLSTVPSIRRYFIVDSWLGNYSNFGQEHMDRIAAEVMAWAATDPRIVVLRMDSAQAATQFVEGSVDFWHTDGDHSLEGITTDITEWRHTVRSGGIMSGDNYEEPSVAAGVDRLLPQRGLAAKGRLWWARV